MSLRLSSRAICSLRSSPRLRRSSCRGQWNLKLVVNVMTSLYRTKQSWPEAGNSRLYYVLFQRRIQKQFIRHSCNSLPHPPCVASTCFGVPPGRLGQRHHQNKNGFIIPIIEVICLLIKLKNLTTQTGIRKRLKITSSHLSLYMLSENDYLFL